MEQLAKRELLKNTIEYRVKIARMAIMKYKSGEAEKLFKAPLYSTLKLVLGRWPWVIEYKDGHVFKSYDAYKFYDDRCKEYAEFSRLEGDRIVRIMHAERGDCDAVFGGAYSWLPVSGRVVLDIGANIADSPIYFALRGAEHVYAFEVMPSTFEIGKRNIEENALQDKVDLYNLGIGRAGSVRFRKEHIAGGDFTLTNYKIVGGGQTTVNIKELWEILEQLNISEAVMKIDCEGCEYNVILGSDRDTLRRFTHIIGEYHFGFKALEDKLLDAGFSFSCSGPYYFYDPSRNPPHFMTGIFHAWKTQNKVS